MKRIRLATLFVLASLISSCIMSQHDNDSTPPVPGLSISFSQTTSLATRVNWGAGQDDYSAAADLSYRVVRGTASTDIDNLQKALTRTGTSLVMDWSANTTTITVNGLSPNTRYWFAVIVKDSAGNMAIYQPASVLTETTSDPSDPVDPSDPIDPIDPIDPGDPATQGIDRFFWGTWVRMDTGQAYYFSNTGVTIGNSEYAASSHNSQSVTAGGLSYIKESDNVLAQGDIRLFREGGASRSFSARVSGFEGSLARSIAVPGASIPVRRRNQNNTEDQQEATSSNEGDVEFSDSVAGDSQELEVTFTSPEGPKTVTVEVTPSFDGEFVGTIPLVVDGYNFKTRHTVDARDLDNGYLYGNNFKDYRVTISIENIGNANAATSLWEIELPSGLSTTSPLNGNFSTLRPGASRDIPLVLSAGTIAGEYEDKTITIRTTDSATMKTWVDYVVLRFYRQPILLAIRAFNIDGGGSLKAFVITPEKRSILFQVSHNTTRNITLPWRDEPYLLAFSGAGHSNEMKYSFTLGGTTPNPVGSETWNLNQINRFDSYNTESSAYWTSSFNGAIDGYLKEGHVSYFKIDVANLHSHPFHPEARSRVIFHNNGGSAVPDQYISTGNRISRPNPAPTRSGYSFVNWYDNASLETPWNFYTYVYSPTELHAAWQLLEYSISYTMNSGTNHEDNPAAYTVESPTIYLQTPTRAGYLFGGFYTDSSFTTLISQISARSTGNLRLYAQWLLDDYYITYNLYGGSNHALNPPSYSITTSTFSLRVPTKAGYAFQGWYTDSGYTSWQVTSVPRGSQGNLEFHAKWAAEYQNIVFNANDGSGSTVNLQILTDAQEELYLNGFYRTGYTFAGWSSQTSGPVEYEDGALFTKAAGTETLYAIWEPDSYPVSYYANGASGGSAPAAQSKIHDQELTLATNTTGGLYRTGHSFDGWATSSDFYGDQYPEGSTYIGNTPLELYAKWVPDTYDVYYNSNGATSGYAPDHQTKTWGQDLVLAWNNGPLHREDADFAGWNTAPDGSGIDYGQGATYSANAHVWLYAKWNPMVSFDGQGGSSNPSNIYNYGALVLQPPDPIRSGYTFGGWYRESTCINAWDFASDTVTEVTILYAKWYENPTVTFDSQEGFIYASRTVSNGGLVSSPATPSRAGYTFGGWYRESTCISAWDFDSDTVTEAMTLWAKWYENPTVSFDSQGGSAVASQATSYGGVVSQPSAPTRSGYTFGGWYRESTCINAWDFSSDTVTEAITLWAKWDQSVIGDVGPAGGIIFYDKGFYSDGWRYLEATIFDHSGGVGTSGINTAEAKESSIGAGYGNTLAIVTARGEGLYAAKICADLEYNGFSDWFLPSKDELNMMYLNRGIIGNFYNSSYWSSTQRSSDHAVWTQNFQDGNQSPSTHNNYNVRAIRAF